MIHLFIIIFYSRNLSLSGSTSSTSTTTPVVSGFSFVAPTDTSTSTLPTASTFSFLNTTPAPAPAPTTASGFSFTTTPSSTSLPTTTTSALPSSTLPTDDNNLPMASGIKKKKPGFRPGFARDEPTATAPTTSTGGSVLSGLTVHEEPNTTDDNTGNSVLAGMRLHAASDAGEDQGEAPSVLSGLQVHNVNTPGTDTNTITPMASGFNFVGNSSPAVTINTTSSLPVIPPTVPTTAQDNGMFGNLLKKSTASTETFQTSTFGTTAARSVSPTARMRNNLTDLNDAARQTRMRLADLKIRLRQLIEQDKVANQEVEKWKSKVSDIERKQDEAIRNELFEEAEQLNESLDAARGSLLAAEGRRRGVLANRTSVEEEQAQVFKES